MIDFKIIDEQERKKINDYLGCMTCEYNTHDGFVTSEMYSLIFSFNDSSDSILSSWVCVDDFIELITSSTSHMLLSMESTFDFSDFKSALSLINKG